MNTKESQPARTPLLDTRVSALLEEDQRVLPLLIDYGFAPLANPVMRKTLAPTVTLAQALRLHPSPPEHQQALLAQLERLRAEHQDR